MLKHSETIINSNVRRQDATWDYRWEYNNSDNPNTIFEKPDMQQEGQFGNETWYFCGDASELRQYDSSTWDPNHPVFEYEVTKNEPPDGPGTGPNEVTDEWDDSHPYNPTRYLSPGDSKFIRITNSVQNVTIDPIPPEFVTDYGTEYLTLESKLDGRKLLKGAQGEKKTKYRFSKGTRTIALEFKDEIGLDYKQVALYIGDEEIDWGNQAETDNIIYYYDRTMKKSIQKDWVEHMSFNATKDGQYRVEFQLNEQWAIEKKQDGKIIYEDNELLTDIINTNEKQKIEYTKEGKQVVRYKFAKAKLNLIVWDLAGNYSIYHITRPFNTLGTDDLNNLVPVDILFKDVEPQNYYLENGIEGKIITDVYDPNDILWEYENVAKLTDISIGVIDKGSYEAGDNRKDPLTGVREFIITHLTESGNVEVEAWVETGFPEIDELIKEKTYNTAICGPWVYGDEGRKYHITPYIPKYLHGTEFADFMEFFQLYINTMYQGMESKKNISALEKIARIGNFNDIARLEDSLVYHYAKQFGNEFDFDVDSLQNVNLIFDGMGFTTRDMKETFDIIKYVLEELPAYNRYKGTNTGITMAIRMFGFACQIINVWVRRDIEVEKDPNFIEEDRLYSYEDYFMTSRFDLELDARNNTFKTFCENIDMFIDLIKSIKPITKILNLVKYTITRDIDVNLVYDMDVIEDTAPELEYTFTWQFDENHLKELENIKRLCTLDNTTGTADLFCLNYRPLIKSDVKCPPMVYNVIGKFLKSKFEEIIFTVEAEKTEKATEEGLDFEIPTTTTYNLSREGLTPILNAGSFFLYLTDATNGTHGYNMIQKFFNFGLIESGYMNVYVTMKFKIQHGTDYARSFTSTKIEA